MRTWHRNALIVTHGESAMVRSRLVVRRTRRIVTLAYVTAVAFAMPVAGQQDGATMSQCGLQFTLPAGWAIAPHPYAVEPECGFSLRPLAWDSLLIAHDSVDHFTMLVRVSEESFVESVPLSPFEAVEARWWVNGRLGLRNEAVAIARNGWQGVSGDGPFGCYRIGGGYAGACETPTALLGTDARSAIIEGGSEDVFRIVLESLRFVP